MLHWLLFTGNCAPCLCHLSDVPFLSRLRNCPLNRRLRTRVRRACPAHGPMCPRISPGTQSLRCGPTVSTQSIQIRRSLCDIPTFYGSVRAVPRSDPDRPAPAAADRAHLTPSANSSLGFVSVCHLSLCLLLASALPLHTRMHSYPQQRLTISCLRCRDDHPNARDSPDRVYHPLSYSGAGLQCIHSPSHSRDIPRSRCHCSHINTRTNTCS